MKLLTLLRHAKSTQDPSYTIDHDRPLAERGQEDAPLMGRLLSRAGMAPDLIVTSTALRARQTADLLARSAGYAGRVGLEEAMYLAGPDTLLSVIRSLPDEANHVMLVGHNPGFEETAGLLIGCNAGGYSLTLPTTAAAHIELEIEHWRDAAEGCGVLKWLVNPKLVKRALA